MTYVLRASGVNSRRVSTRWLCTSRTVVLGTLFYHVRVGLFASKAALELVPYIPMDGVSVLHNIPKLSFPSRLRTRSRHPDLVWQNAEVKVLQYVTSCHLGGERHQVYEHLNHHTYAYSGRGHDSG